MDRNELDSILVDHRILFEEGVGECANLTGADLRGMDLSGVFLREADLDDAILVGADLSNADLSYVNFVGADLTDADLTDANLAVANLTGAKVPPSIRHCWNLERATFPADALPWLILHPNWNSLKDTVKIVESN